MTGATAKCGGQQLGTYSAERPQAALSDKCGLLFLELCWKDFVESKPIAHADISYFAVPARFSQFLTQPLFLIRSRIGSLSA